MFEKVKEEKSPEWEFGICEAGKKKRKGGGRGEGEEEGNRRRNGNEGNVCGAARLYQVWYFLVVSFVVPHLFLVAKL